MRRYSWMAVLVALALSLSLTASVEARTGGSDRPWSGSAAGQTWFDVANPKDCGAGITTRADEPAIATHFGAAFIVMSHCPTGDPADNFADAEFALVAANGDAVYGTYAGTIDEYSEVIGAVGTFTVHLTVTGGDGRFEGATGTAVMKAHVIFEGYDDLSWPWWVSWEGTLSY